MSASVAAETATEGKKLRRGGVIGPRLKGFMLALVVPLLLLLGWHLAGLHPGSVHPGAAPPERHDGARYHQRARTLW